MNRVPGTLRRVVGDEERERRGAASVRPERVRIRHQHRFGVAIETASNDAGIFRFPDLRHPPEMLTYLGQRNIASFSTDIDSFDFKIKKPDQLVKSLIGKTAQLEFKIVDDGSQYMKKLGAYADTKKDAYPGLEVGFDAWQAKDSGTQHDDVYLKAKDRDELAPSLRVPARTPPVFLAHGGEDVISSPEHSVVFPEPGSPRTTMQS